VLSLLCGRAVLSPLCVDVAPPGMRGLRGGRGTVVAAPVIDKLRLLSRAVGSANALHLSVVTPSQCDKSRLVSAVSGASALNPSSLIPSLNDKSRLVSAVSL
jgi:hypothetical protein